MKKALSLLTAVILICGLCMIPASAAGNGELTVSSADAKRGETVTLDVNMPSNPGLVTMSIEMSYDTNTLELTNVTDTGLLVGIQLNPTYGSPYTMTWTDGSTEKDNTATGTIAKFTFKVKDDAAIGDTDVTLLFKDSFDADYKPNTFSVAQGKVTVACNEHNFGEFDKLNDEQHMHKCNACGYEEVAEHTWNDGEVTVDATCTEEGEKTYTCTACGATKVETIEKTAHTWNEGTVINEPTCTEKGSKDVVCTVCGAEATIDIDALGHKWDEGKTTKEATATEDGEKTFTCSVCNATKVEKINALGNADSGTGENTNAIAVGTKTGDTTNIALYSVMAVMAFGVVAFVILKKKSING